LAAIFSGCKEQDPGEYVLEEKGSWFSLYENIDEAGNFYVSTDVCFDIALEKDFNYLYLNGVDDLFIRYGVRKIEKKNITITTYLYGDFGYGNSVFGHRPKIEVHYFLDDSFGKIGIIINGNDFKFTRHIHNQYDSYNESYTYNFRERILVGPVGTNQKADVDSLNTLISKYIKVRDIVIY
jgi:hypothetical protein